MWRNRGKNKLKYGVENGVVSSQIAHFTDESAAALDPP